MTARQNMTPQEFREALARLGLTPSAFANLIGSNDKNMRRAAEDESDGPGPAAAFALRCLLAFERVASIRERNANPRRPEGPALAGDEYETAFLDAEEIAKQVLRGEFPEAQS